MNKRYACYVFVLAILLSMALAVPAVAENAPVTINTINEQNYSVDRASIYIDDQYYGFTDMVGHMVLEQYPVGNHTITAVRDGFVNGTEVALLAPGAEVDLVLTHNYAAVGKDAVTFLVVENTVAFSKVAGASIYIDGKLIGKTNTVGGRLTAEIPAGMHEILVSKPENVDLLDNKTIIDIQPGDTYLITMGMSGKKYSLLDPWLFRVSLERILFQGLVNTILLSIVAFAIGIIIGLAMGIGRTSANRALRIISSVYVEGVRGLPLLLQLLFVNFGLPYLISELIGASFNIDIFTACVIALSMNSGAYMGEIFKAGIEAVHKGQTEAARSLGMTQNQAMRHIILPQAFKIVLPALGNEFIALIKDSSIGLVIALPEIVYYAKSMGAQYYNTFTPILAAGIVYLLITIPLGKAVQYIEKKYNVNARNGNLPDKKKKKQVPPQEVPL